MADSLLPWMRDYFTDLVQKYGSDILNTPVYTRNKKVQIIRFLTYGAQAQDTEIWAEASDKQYFIPIKFTLEAISEFSKTNVGQRLTQHKGAIARIQKFRLISTTASLAGGGQTIQPSLAFECSSVSILGSSGEATFGNPLPLGSLSDIASWSHSPDRMRKSYHQGRSTIQTPPKVTARQGKVHSEIVSGKMPPGTTSFSVTHVGQSIDVPNIPLTKNGTQNLKSYTATWQLVTKGRKFDINSITSDHTLDTEVKRSEKDIESGVRGQQDEAQKTRSRSGSPVSNWGPSPIATKKWASPVRASTAAMPSSGLPAPTPAQRRRGSPVPLTPEYLSSYPLGNETVIESEPGGTQAQERRPIPRKIPRPASPEPPRGTGPVLVLAPNSDTSGTQSQSQTYDSRPTIKREDEIDKGGGILGAVNAHVEDGLMSEEYPWINLREMRRMMGRIMDARGG